MSIMYHVMYIHYITCIILLCTLLLAMDLVASALEGIHHLACNVVQEHATCVLIQLRLESKVELQTYPAATVGRRRK